MNNLIEQIQKQLQLISVTNMESIEVTQSDRAIVYCQGLRFGKYTEKFTVALTKTGKVKNGSIRFYE